MSDVVLITPRDVPTGAARLHNENVVITDQEYAALDPALRVFYEKIRENLGVGCIASYLRQQGLDVTLLNLHGRNPSDDAVRTFLRRENPRFVGVSIMYDIHWLDAVRLIRCARDVLPEVMIAAGGAFCTYNGDIMVGRIEELDCVASGEGELTAASLVDACMHGRDWRGTPGIYYRDGDRVVSTGLPELLDLHEAPAPARDVLEQHRAAGIATGVASTYTSRGCHANCTFCYAPRAPGAVGTRWRVRSPDAIVDEIEYLQREFGTRFLWFNDDNFGGAFAEGFEHALTIAEEILRRGIEIRFHAEFRVDSGLIDREALRTLYRAGLHSTLLGLESGSPRVLKRFRKGATVDHNFDAAQLVKKFDVDLDPGWIMFEPGTTLDDLWDDLCFIVGARLHRTGNPFYLFNRAIALRGTELFEEVYVDPATGTEPQPAADPAEQVLAQARCDYEIPDRRVEALWRAWSEIGGIVGSRRENEAPFLAQRCARAARADRSGPGAASMRALLRRLREWRRSLPDLFLSLLTTGLDLADGYDESEGGALQAELDHTLAQLVDAHDEHTLGMPFEQFRSYVETLETAGRHAVAQA